MKNSIEQKSHPLHWHLANDWVIGDGDFVVCKIVPANFVSSEKWIKIDSKTGERQIFITKYQARKKFYSPENNFCFMCQQCQPKKI